MAMHKNICRPNTDSYDTLSQLMYNFLSSLDSNWMQDTMSIFVADKTSILEAAWQKEFYRFASQNLCANSTVSVEVTHGKIEQKEFKIDGKVDFYIDGSRQWAVEFLIQGHITKGGVSAAEEHANRFNSSYKNLPWKECLLVDFRPKTKIYMDFIESYIEISEEKKIPVYKKRFLPNYWIVVYDNTNYDKLDIFMYDKNGNLIVHKDNLHEIIIFDKKGNKFVHKDNNAITLHLLNQTTTTPTTTITTTTTNTTTTTTIIPTPH